MNTSALIVMLLSKGIITAFTFYFFIKMLRTPLSEVVEDDLNYPRGG